MHTFRFVMSSILFLSLTSAQARGTENSGSSETIGIVAPVDGYVCYPEISDCPPSPIPTRWHQLFSRELLSLTGEPALGRTDIGYFPVPKLNLITSSTEARSSTRKYRQDGKDACPTMQFEDGSSQPLAYPQPGLETACVRYYSPPLISQYIEDLKRLKHAVHSCERTMKALARQQRMLAIEQSLSSPEIKAGLITDELTHVELDRAKVSSARQEEFKSEREKILNGRDKLRAEMRSQVLGDDYANRVADSILQIEVARDAVERSRFSISELATSSCPSNYSRRPVRLNNSWVTKGTTVIELSDKP